MPERVGDTAVLYGPRHKLSIWFKDSRMFSHGDGVIRVFKHRQVVAAVAEHIGPFLRDVLFL